jgi:hypothetical protein
MAFFRSAPRASTGREIGSRASDGAFDRAGKDSGLAPAQHAAEGWQWVVSLGRDVEGMQHEKVVFFDVAKAKLTGAEVEVEV